MESKEKEGDRWLRLGDLVAHEVIVVRCPCGRSVEYHKGYLQRRHRVPSDFLVYDLQFRLRCKGCNRWSGFRIMIFDNRMRGDNWKPRWSGWLWRGSEGGSQCSAARFKYDGLRSQFRAEAPCWSLSP